MCNKFLQLTLGILLSTIFYQDSYAVTRDVPATYATIQAALNAAAAGDIILVQPGTYTENLVWPNVDFVILRSAGNSSNTIIDANSTGRACNMNQTGARKTACMEGITFQNGAIGGSNAYGAGIYNRGYELILSDVILKDNIATGSSRAYGGGLYTYNNTRVTINNCSFLQNQAISPASGSWAYGGGLYSYTGAQVDLNNVIFDGNIASNPSRSYGAAIYGAGITGTWNSLQLMNNECQQASWAGASVYLSNNSIIEMNDISVHDNRSFADNWVYGGGLRIIESNVSIDGISVSCNTGNAGTWAYAAGLYTDGANGNLVNLNIVNGLVCDNQLGGNNSFTYGVGLYIRDYTNFNLTNGTLGGNTFVGSGPNPRGKSIHDGGTGNTSSINNSILYNAAGGGPELGGTAHTVSFSDVRGGFVGTGNIDIDPLWLGLGDYHFSPGSPNTVINGGSAGSAAALDLDDNARPNGGAPAMGAYEELTANVGAACDWVPPAVTISSSHPTLLSIDDLISFEAQEQNGHVLTTWATSREVDSDRFELERSSDGISFESIATITAAGNSNSLLEYSFTDNNALWGVSYYRLKLIDYNNNNFYTHVEAVNIDRKDNVQFYPAFWKNDVQTVYISSKIEDEVHLTLSSILGQELMRSSKQKITANSNNGISLDLKDIPNGHYLLKVNGKQLNFVRQVVIQH